MTTIQLAFALLACCLGIGLFMPSWWCLVIALAIGVALWLEHRGFQRSTRQ